MNDDGTRGSSRRAFLAGAGAVAGTALAGCGGLVSRPGSGGTPTARDVTLAAPYKGPEDAPVTVGVYKDFACPACRDFNRVVAPRIESEYVDSEVVRYEHYDFPLDNHAPASYTAANAARAVQHDADDAAFFSFADALFDNQSDLGPSTYATLANDLDATVDGDRVRSAAEGRTYREVVSADKQMGIDAGVRATPTVVVDGSIVEQRSWEGIRSAIEAARPESG
ncbi:DsbA family protein [Halosimplex pelagicum]|uniref:Thioredoxin domain-containing protein n=1 Tax=Halosimplex pelagicum TaxID=869886 RepID=A0A7D5PCW9_9EURY|nr:thioredoxin domain-containing protein [Halosimplex pelagicum]QLH83562.1 thioredoxin domain-containing protein [Halosimplex pelagicum]